VLNGGTQTPRDLHHPKATVAKFDGDRLASLVGRQNGVAGSTVTVTLRDDNGLVQDGKVGLPGGRQRLLVITTSPATTNAPAWPSSRSLTPPLRP